MIPCLRRNWQVWNLKLFNKVLIPKIIKEIYPDLNDEDVEAVRQYVVLDSVVKKWRNCRARR